MSYQISKRTLLAVIGILGIFHIVTFSQIPWVKTGESWYVSPAYAHFKNGTFENPMFPDLVNLENGSFGQGKLRYLVQSYSFKLFGFGVYQARLPMFLGGMILVYLIYLVGRSLFGSHAGLYGATLAVLSRIFYEPHLSYSHSYVACLFILAAYFFVRLLHERKPVYAFASGFAVWMSLNFHLTGVLGAIPLSFILLHHRLFNKVNNAQVLFFLSGSLAALGIWYLFEIVPIGLNAFIEKSSYGVGVAKSHYIGWQWVKYFSGKRGAFFELPLLLVVICSFTRFRHKPERQFFYLFSLGLVIAYCLFSGSGSLITVWAALFVLAGGLISDISQSAPGKPRLSRRVCSGVLLLTLLYYSAFQLRRGHSAVSIRPLDQYSELTEELASHIPEGKTVIGSPLYWFKFAGRNPYLAQNFYWERVNSKTGELGDLNQPDSVSVRKMITFLNRRSVEYMVADDYFRSSLKTRIPERFWKSIFSIEGEIESQLYGGHSRGGPPPYKIQIWRLTNDWTI